MQTEKSKQSIYEEKTRELVNTLQDHHPNPEADALEVLVAACSSMRFDVMTPLERANFAEGIQEQAEFLRHFIH